MKSTRQIFQIITISICCSLLMAPTVQAVDEFPSRPVTIVSPYQAGGTSDIIARVLAQSLTDQWRKGVIVENRPGANGGIGVSAVLQAPPDGHTLLMVASSALTINPLFYSKLPYEVSRDLAPITRAGTVPNVLVVHPSVPVKSVQDLIAFAKATPGKLTYASQGNGSNGHVTGELFKQRAGVEMLHIPYKGSAPAVRDLVGGQVQIMFDNLPTALPLIQSGQLRALAVTTAQRSSRLPNIPTIAESGLPGFDTSAWFALLSPKHVPQGTRQEIESGVIKALNLAETRARLEAAGIDVTADGSTALEKRINDETQMWRDVVSKAGIKVDQ